MMSFSAERDERHRNFDVLLDIQKYIVLPIGALTTIRHLQSLHAELS